YPLPGTKFFDHVQTQLGEKTNWSDSEDLSMMFQGAYTDELYRALHDALHAQVRSFNSGDEYATSSPAELRNRVVQLEKSWRNARATAPPSFVSQGLVQLQS